MKPKLLMVGVHQSHTGGMWTVAENYCQSPALAEAYAVRYLPLSRAGSALQRVFYSGWAFVRYIGLLLFKSPDLVYIHTASQGSFWRKSLAVRLAAVLGKPVILHLHGARFQEFYQGLGPGARRYAQKTFLQCGAVVCLGQVWADFITEICGEAVKTVILRNAVPVPAQNPYDTKARELVFFGRVGQRKGAFDLLCALGQVKDRLPADVICSLYGDGELDKAAELVAQYGLEGRVHLRGWVGPQQREQAMRKAMVNLLPSYNEGLPMSVLETMAEGIPNITTRIAAIPEVVQDGVNGILLNPGDVDGLGQALVRLARNEALRAGMSARAHETIRQSFCLERHMEELVTICKQVACKAAASYSEPAA